MNILSKYCTSQWMHKNNTIIGGECITRRVIVIVLLQFPIHYYKIWPETDPTQRAWARESERDREREGEKDRERERERQRLCYCCAAANAAGYMKKLPDLLKKIRNMNYDPSILQYLKALEILLAILQMLNFP